MENISEHLIFDLFICQRKFEKALKQIAETFGASKNNLEIIFLIYLYKNPGITQYDLCTKFDIERSHINKIIKKLESEKFLEMKGTVHLGLFRKEIYLTKRGIDVAGPTLEIMKKFKNDIFKRHPLMDFHGFASNVNLLSRVSKEDVTETVNNSLLLHIK